MIRRLRSLIRVLRFRGPGYPGYLAAGYLWPRLARWILFEGRHSRLAQRLFQRLSRRSLPPRRGSAGARPEDGPADSSWLPEATREAAFARRRESGAASVVLGRIDNDGRLLGVCGPLPGLDEVDETSFVRRYRYDLDVILDGDLVALRKNYRGDRQAFLREWRSLATLGAPAGHPAVHRVDEQGLVLHKSFVPGQTLRQHLVRAGARILSVDTEAEPELTRLAPAERIEAVWARGRAVFAEACPAGFRSALERRLDAVHRRGVTGFSLSFGNVVLHQETGEPWFIDFDAAETHDDLRSLRFALGRDRDRELFNRIYGRELLTECAARGLLANISTPYSPVDLGHGLANRGFWSVDSGTGRWEFLNRRALGGLVRGQRILDLGAFHGLMLLLMLAAGARQAVALEKEPENVEMGRHLRRLFEWRDMRSYDLDLRCGDMREVLSGDWGTFDLVTAFCSLYYLSEDDMARVVRRAAQLSPVMVLQAKTDTRAEAADGKAVKSSVPFLRALLETNGFPRIELIAPDGYSRPLLIGRRSSQDPSS